MIFVDGQSNERLVLDGEWFEKLRGGQSKTRAPASSFRGVAWKDIDGGCGCWAARGKSWFR
jgi:hypothetical protein